jgi:hypothetical protein
VALYDRSKAERSYAPGVYLTDNVTLWRVLDIPEEQRKGLVPLEDCRFPDAPPVWRGLGWLSQHDAKVVRP